LHDTPGNWATPAEPEVVSFEGGNFRQAPLADGYLGYAAYEIDTLVALYEHLEVQDILPALHGYASLIAGTNRIGRLEFNTFGAGRYLGLLSDLQKANGAVLGPAEQPSERRLPHLQPCAVPLLGFDFLELDGIIDGEEVILEQGRPEPSGRAE
jgi:hypothetical protein